MSSLEALISQADDFCPSFEAQWPRHQLAQNSTRRRRLSLGELMTMVIAFHQSSSCTFKHYSRKQVCRYWSGDCPQSVSYNRFVESMPATLIPRGVYLTHGFGRCTGMSFIHATSLKVCHNRRIQHHQVFCRS